MRIRHRRQTGSRIQACAIAVVAFLTATPARAEPILLSSMTLNGTAQLIAPDLLRLVPNVETNPDGDPPAGSAWTPSRFDVVTPWAVEFDFRMSDPDPNAQLDVDGSGGDGFAFVIQNDPFFGTGALGRGAGGMGFLGIYNSVAVMFDTYQNNVAYGDPNGNYIAVNTRGTDFNVPHHFCTGGALTTDPAVIDLPGEHCTEDPVLAMTTAVPRLDGPVHTVRVTYQPGTMNIFLDSMPALSFGLDLGSTLDLANGTDAFFGFTAGSRFSYQNHDILSFSHASIPEPSLLALSGIAAAAALRRRRRRR